MHVLIIMMCSTGLLVFAAVITQLTPRIAYPLTSHPILFGSGLPTPEDCLLWVLLVVSLVEV